jgi:hypothetical protein
MMNSAHSARRGSPLAGTGVLERPRYYPRQLITPSDMTLEQRYFRDRLRRHNRLLHGWGVVCGAQVCRVAGPGQRGAEPWLLRVSSGYILGPHGDEILIQKEVTIDLRSLGGRGEPDCPGSEGSDPWCAPILVKPDDSPVYLAVRFDENMSRPVRVQPGGCGCDDSGCEYSRWTDGYRFGLLPGCPTSHLTPPNLDDLMKGLLPSCPECPVDPWVVLARVEFDAEGSITVIDNCSCRRMAVSFASAWWQCQNATLDAVVETVAVEQGQKKAKLVVTGKRLSDVCGADLGEGVVVRHLNVVSPERIEIECDIMPDAAPGSRTLRLTTCCEGTVSKEDALKIGRGAPPEKRPRKRAREEQAEEEGGPAR